MSLKVAFNGNWELGHLGYLRYLFLTIFVVLLIFYNKESLVGKNKEQNLYLFSSSSFKFLGNFFALYALVITPLYLVSIIRAFSPIAEILIIKYFHKNEQINLKRNSWNIY